MAVAYQCDRCKDVVAKAEDLTKVSVSVGSLEKGGISVAMDACPKCVAQVTKIIKTRVTLEEKPEHKPRKPKAGATA